MLLFCTDSVKKTSNVNGLLAGRDMVCCPFKFILVSCCLFSIEPLTPFPPSFCLGRNPILPAQVSFLFSVRQARSMHPWAGGVLLQDVWRASGFPASSSAGGEPPRERAGSSQARPHRQPPAGSLARGTRYVIPPLRLS